LPEVLEQGIPGLEGAVIVTESTGDVADQPVRPLGWSRHELTHFHGAARRLLAEGFSVVTDHGLSDEGDPWFVLCHAESDEIIVHFARIGGTYVACVPFRSGALTGGLLPDLVDRFLRRVDSALTGAVRIRSTPAA
jgi:hypothetical protein